MTELGLACAGSCALQPVKFGTNWTATALAPARFVGVNEPAVPKLVAFCCQEPCREAEDCDVEIDKEVSDRATLEPDAWVDGEVDCNEPGPGSDSR